MLAWGEFCRGKRKAKDVQEFERNLADTILELHGQLLSGEYRHGGYYRFRINDPKPRAIHKASVRDRLVHHALYRKLYPFFDRKFVFDSYSCRLSKGTHKAMNRFKDYAHQLSQNNTRTVWVLKCDIRKFFDTIDHDTLIRLLCYSIADKEIIFLLENIIQSFSVPLTDMMHHIGEREALPTKGLPLGNLTSQLLVNIYMNEFDQWVKHRLKVGHYIRYADDFVFLSHSREELESFVAPVAQFLQDRLSLELHPKKLFISTIVSGVDFLGWVHFPDHRVLRTAAKNRMIRTIHSKPKTAVLQSYQGLLQHGNAMLLRQRIANLYWLLGGDCP